MPLTRNTASQILVAVLLVVGSTVSLAATVSDAQRELFKRVYADVELGNWSAVEALGDDDQRALEARQFEAIEPNPHEMDELMRAVYAIKAGKHDASTAKTMQTLGEALVKQGAGAVIAGCTEIPLVLGQSMLDVPLLSSTDILAQKTVQLSLPE